jgi:hypothetical protein
VLTFIDRKRALTRGPRKLLLLPRLHSQRRKCCWPLVSGLLADYFGTSSPSARLPRHPTYRCRPDERHDACVAHCGRVTIIWPYTRGTAALVTIAVTYGASSSAMVALIGAPMMALGDCADVGRRTGMFFTILSIGALAGPPISGAINHHTGGYTGVGLFAGA